MIVSAKRTQHVLVVHEYKEQLNSEEKVLNKLLVELEKDKVDVQLASTEFDAEMIIMADPMIQAILVDWDFGNSKTHYAAINVLNKIRERDKKVPVFLFAKRANVADIPVDVLTATSDFIWLYEDTADFIAGRIRVAMEKYERNILPPLFKAMKEFSDIHEYSWHTPGHSGGTAFLKSAAGRAFYDYYGESLFRTDLSISVGELGSLLDHSGPIGASERYSAKVFGADRTYSVTNGTSTSNRVVFMACVTRGQIALVDRNCHKSIEQSIIMTGAIPQYMVPKCNFYGIPGPIAPSELSKMSLKNAMAVNPMVKGGTDPKPALAIITNSTYDGLCYNVRRVEELLAPTVDRVHFDEAWFAYARFNPLYADRFAMFDEAGEHNKNSMTVFATQSTHKLLAALSQASFIHVREGSRGGVDEVRFNEAFMMHASTSPNYPILTSNDVATAMMDNNGKTLTDEAIHEAIAFRKLISKIHAEFKSRGEWFFDCWQPDFVVDESFGKKVPFYMAESQQLATDPKCWLLQPGDSWHGFGDIEPNYCMLDPIKVSVTTPGVGPEGIAEDFGIPATVLSAYLGANGIIPEKTKDNTILFLFSMGITKGKWGTLVDYLLKFKQDYDDNTSLEECLPNIYATGKERYENMGLRDLCQELFEFQKQLKTTHNMSVAFSTLPKVDMTPVEAYERLVRNEVERVDLEAAANRTIATIIVPYPPGIPLVMPGENLGAADGPALRYLKDLEALDQRFPGFKHDSHGVIREKDKYYLTVLKK